MMHTASKALLAVACVIAAAQAGAQQYGDAYAYPQRDPYANPQRPYGPAGAARVVHCESNDFRRNFCAIRLRPNDQVSLVRRYSERGCVQGRTWFTDARGIWVDDGCRADFLVARRPMRPQGERARYRPRDRDDADDRGGPYREDRDGDRYDDRSGRQGPDPYSARARNAPPSDRDGDGDDERQQYPAPQSYDRNAPPRGSVTVRDPNDPQDRGHRMDDCDGSDNGQDARDDCEAPTGANPDRR